MTGYNRVILVGNITRDPELRQIASGESVAELGLAVSERSRDKDGELIEKTCFTDVTVWGKRAEACCRYLVKGEPVLVEGRLQLDRWETPEGEKRSRLRVRGDQVRFMGSKNGSHNGNGDDPKQVDQPTEAEQMPF